MCRILSKFVSVQRRISVDRATWNLDDLLFISAVGNEKSDQREIAFAHFHQETGDLPNSALSSAGMGLNTPLKMD